MFSSIASWPAYRFLRRLVRWSGIPISWRIFQLLVIHTFKGFSIVNEAEVDVFLEFSCFFYDPTDVLAIWSLVPLPFLNPAWTSGSSWVHVLLKPGLENFEHYFAILLCSLALAFFGFGMETDLFQSCGHCWVFQICWHIEWSTFTASSFRIWNSSTGIPSLLLALFAVMLPKVHLTLHSRMSGSRWVTTPSWLSRSWRYFLYSSVLSYHLFLISSASVRSIPFLFFIEPIFAWSIPLVYLIFLKRSLVFLILLLSSISLHWSLRSAFLSLLTILWNYAFKYVYLSFSPLPFTSLLFSAICKASSDNHFAFPDFVFRRN